LASEPIIPCKVSHRAQVTAKGATCEFSCAEGERILYAGLSAGLALPYECASGTCGTCRASVVAGETEYAWAEAPGRKYTKAARNEVLMCQSVALSDIALEIVRFPEAGRPRYAPRYLEGRIEGTRALTTDVVAFDVQLDGLMPFEAGQFALLETEAVRGARAYSMVNFGPEPRKLRFLVKRLAGGAFTDWLFSASRDGERLRIFGPLGRATFDPAATRNIVCIAGGSGIAGMMSILAHAAAEGHFSRHTAAVYFGVRTPRDAFYLEELRAHARAFPGNVRVVVGLSHEDPSGPVRAAHPELEFDRGFIHEVAKRSLGTAPADTVVYVAGPPPMVDAALKMLLVELKVSGAAIRYDKFS